MTTTPTPGIAIPTSVPPMPTALAVDFDLIDAPDGTRLVALRLQQPTGITIAMLTADSAKQIAQNMLNAASQASSGLVVQRLRLAPGGPL